MVCPADYPQATFDDYVEVAVASVADQPDPVVVVAQSMSGLFAPAIAERGPVSLVVLLAAMIPAAGETGRQWWPNTGQPSAQAAHLDGLGMGDADPYDPFVVFVHDLPAEVARESGEHVREQHDGPMLTPNPMTGWPAVPTVVLAPEDDRLFPATFVRRVALDRLGLETTTIPGGHLAALSQPEAVAAQILKPIHSTEGS